MEVLVFLASLVCLASCQQSPVISSISQERVVNIGDTVDLECSVQYISEYSVIWVKLNEGNNNLFISTGSKIVVPGQRFSIRHDESSSTYTLQITKLQETDTGLYQCQIVIGATSKITADVWVHVRVPPIISDNSTRSIVTSTGTNVSLECYAGGYPTPRVFWRRENNDLLPTGGTEYKGNVLNIYNVTKDDRGTYYCIADNSVGEGARRNIGVEVEFAPVVTVDRPRYGQALQNPMDLQCHIEAFPSPSVLWLKDDYHLTDNQFYQISIFSTADEFTDSTLRIISIEKKQYGNYTCKAINKLGSDEQVVELYETVNVICPPACDKSYSSGATRLQTRSLWFLQLAAWAALFFWVNGKH
ncbi:lachesin [Ixodes scapularis]|uniref:lachesin n=1 Tax=Ixodes scapularis TaxID=6945 RepID=UPI001C395612|nr:lachesin [Ixodes scapularis]